MLNFFRRFNRSLNTEAVRADLHSILVELNPENTFEHRMEFMAKLVDWTKTPVTVGNEVKDYHASRNLRIKFLLQFLDRHEEVAPYFFRTFNELMGRGKIIRLLCITGVSDNNGFFSELTDRAIMKILPVAFKEKDLVEVCRFLFKESADVIWFEQYAENIFEPFMQVAKKYDVDFDNIKYDLEDALIILGSHIASLGVSRQIRRHLQHSELSDSSFVRLSMSINRLDTPDNILKELVECRKRIIQVRESLEASGVSVNLIYMIEKLESFINRVEYLLHLRYNPINSSLLSKFIGKLIEDEHKNMGIREFIQHNIHLLTRKIVERAGDKGEHYIADSAKDKRELFVAASWAGVLTAFTAVFKYWIGAARLPYFFEGFFFFINYAISFLIMQQWHLALSSKQPAYTASALSKKFEQFKVTRELSDIIHEVKKINYSQFLAFLGNCLWVVPLVYLFDLISKYSFGHSIVSEKDAYLIINKHSIFTSLTIAYAALTGILLWASSVAAGWTENWIIYRNIHILLSKSKTLKLILGKEKTHQFAEGFPALISATVGSLSIALFLATPVIIGKIFGIPLDIRHVTLAAGTVTMAISSISPGLDLWYIYVDMIISVLVIGALNFGISFYCAIRMAATAREIDVKYLKTIFKFSLSGKKFRKLDITQEVK